MVLQEEVWRGREVCEDDVGGEDSVTEVRCVVWSV